MESHSANQWPSKYKFNEIEIGESKFVHGQLKLIRGAASMWGRRYSIWLRVKKVPGGGMVTRFAAPIYSRRNEQLEVMDALRTLTLLVLDVKNKLEDLK